MIACLSAIAMLAMGLPPVDPPPQPEFDASVDYVSWLRGQVTYAADNNAVEPLADLLYKSGDAKGVAPADDLIDTAPSGVSTMMTTVLREPIPWPPTKFDLLSDWVLKMTPKWLPAFKAAAERPHFALRIDPKWNSLRDATSGNLANCTLMGRTFLAGAWRISGHLTYAGDFEAALYANFTLTDRYAQSLSPDAQLLAAGHRDFLYDQLRYACPNQLIKVTNWRRIEAFLEHADIEPITSCYARGLYFEQARAYEDLQHLFRADPDGDGFTFDAAAWTALIEKDSRLARLPTQVYEQLTQSDPKVLAESIRVHYDAYRALLESGDGRDLERELANIDDNSVRSFPALRALAMSHGLGVKNAFRQEARRRAVHIYVKALVKFYETRKWPESFDELSGDDVATCRIDPFTGEDLRTRIVHKSLLIYSVGADGHDDQASELTDVVFVTRPSKR